MAVRMSVHSKRIMHRRQSLALIAGAMAGAATRAAVAQQDYPNRALKLVVPYPPGASTDQLARIVGLRISQALGQPVVVENRGGAGGNIGIKSAGIKAE